MNSHMKKCCDHNVKGVKATDISKVVIVLVKVLLFDCNSCLVVCR